MFRLIVAFTAVLAVVSAMNSIAAEQAQSDPVSVIKRLFEARNSGNADAAVELFAVDGEIINVVGTRFIGRDEIRKFLAAGIAQKGRYDLEEIRSAGGTVTWTD